MAVFQSTNKGRGLVISFSFQVAMFNKENTQNGHCLQRSRLKRGTLSIHYEKMSELSNEKLPNLTIEIRIIVFPSMKQIYMYHMNDLLENFSIQGHQTN